MPYRRTEKVVRRLAARRAAIIAAARDAASEGGMAAVQIAPVARRAGIAAGTVYRYFPGKIDLVAALVTEISASEIAALHHAAGAAPGPLSALSAAIMTFATRVLRNRRLSFAATAEPVDGVLDPTQLAFRNSLAEEFSARISAAVAGGHLPAQNTRLAATALVGLLIETLIGPLAQVPGGQENKQENKLEEDKQERERVQSLTLIALRALGVADARARGLVVQTKLSSEAAS
ncbi:MAG: TetR/AcrR family transcriptional regulator [Xanthobacteraceae bacterium]